MIHLMLDRYGKKLIIFYDMHIAVTITILYLCIGETLNVFIDARHTETSLLVGC